MKRHSWTFAVGRLLLAAFLLVAGAPAVRAQASGGGVQNQGYIDQPLRILASEKPSGTLRVIVQATSSEKASEAASRRGGEVRQQIPVVGGIAAELRASEIEALAREPGVTHVALDPLMRVAATPDQATPPPVSVVRETIGSAALTALGTTGKTIGVAVIDSGVRRGRDFGYPSRVTDSQQFADGQSAAADQYGHGTWVSGIAAGDGAESAGRYGGVAPGASVLDLKVSDDLGRSYASDVISAIGWAIQERRAYNIRVINLSLVSTTRQGYATNLLDAAVEMAWHQNIVVVAAAGNGGPGTVQFAPANDPYVITVGASDDRTTASPADDVLAAFSSTGPTQDGFAKPEIVAPGRGIVGPLSSNGARLAKLFPNRVVAQQYIQLSGTSASAGVVSGAVALMLQARPELTPDQVKWLLARTARPVAGSSAGVGAGLLDVLAAVKYPGTPGQANGGLIPNQLVAQAYLAASGSGAVSWDSVSWDSVSWDSVSWDSVSWDSVSWDSVSWDSILGD